MKANPKAIQFFADRTKCFMCKHKFKEGYILPVKKPERNLYQPNYNMDVLFHVQDTHGIPWRSTIKMIFNTIYGIENTMQSVYGQSIESDRGLDG